MPEVKCWVVLLNGAPSSVALSAVAAQGRLFLAEHGAQLAEATLTWTEPTPPKRPAKPKRRKRA